MGWGKLLILPSCVWISPKHHFFFIIVLRWRLICLSPELEVCNGAVEVGYFVRSSHSQLGKTRICQSQPLGYLTIPPCLVLIAYVIDVAVCKLQL